MEENVIKGKEMRMRFRLREEMAFEEKDANEMNYVARENKRGFTDLYVSQRKCTKLFNSAF